MAEMVCTNAEAEVQAKILKKLRICYQKTWSQVALSKPRLTF